jgi:hypothetical protein
MSLNCCIPLELEFSMYLIVSRRPAMIMGPSMNEYLRRIRSSSPSARRKADVIKRWQISEPEP